MANFIISPFAISFESIKNNLQNYIQSKPEDERWKDFYTSSAGETIIEIAAALGAFYAYQFIVGRRESYLSTAQNYTSLLGLAENNGYSCDRGHNLHVNITFNVAQTVTLSKWDIIGSYAEYDIILLEDIILNAGEQVTVPVVIGKLLEESLQVTTNRLTQFNFTHPTVTEDYRLLLNNVEIPVSNEIANLVNDYYVAISNTYGAVDVFYLQHGDHNYSVGDTLSLQFVERNNLTWESFSLSNVNLDYGITDSHSLIENRKDLESSNQIKIKAPLYHETSKVIRSRRDYSKYLLLSNPELLAVNDHDINPGLIELTYLRINGQAMTDAEKELWLDSIEESRPSGVARAIITEPVKVNKSLTIKLWRSSDSNIDANISDDIDDILASYENKFEAEIDLNQVEHDIEQLDGIKIARVDIGVGSWSANTKFTQYDFISADDKTFYVVDYQYKSGNNEPTWPANIGDTVVDNNLVWKKVNTYESTVVHTWHANTAYSLYDYIRKDELTDGTYAASGTVEPIWGDNTVIDNNIIWTKVNDVGTLTWGASRIYSLNDIIQVGSVGETYYYKCTHCYVYEETNIYMVSNYTLKSGSTTPTWGDNIVYDNFIVWTKLNSGTSSNTWSSNHSYQIGDTIQNGDDCYVVSSFMGQSGSTEPDWDNLQAGRVLDGNIIWALMDENARILVLQWNQYLNLTKTYSIVG